MTFYFLKWSPPCIGYSAKDMKFHGQKQKVSAFIRTFNEIETVPGSILDSLENKRTLIRKASRKQILHIVIEILTRRRNVNWNSFLNITYRVVSISKSPVNIATLFIRCSKRAMVYVIYCAVRTVDHNLYLAGFVRPTLEE